MVCVQDPVCGANIAWDQAAAVVRYHGPLHYFCCRSCRLKFVRNPRRYLVADRKAHCLGREPDAH